MFETDKYITLNDIHQIYYDDILPITQQSGIYHRLPKLSKNRKLLANCQPLTLLNASYKLISDILAEG